MKKIYIIVLISITTVIQVMAGSTGRPYLFSRIDHQQGLSNSAVLCLFQDNEELMWFGTYDGVNCWDGKNMEVYRSNFSEDRTLSNNVIHGIQQADNGCLWISTHLGVNRLSKRGRQVTANYDFTGDYFVHSNSRGNTWVIAGDGIYYYNTFHQKFIPIRRSALQIEQMERRAFVTDDGTLWLFQPGAGKYQNYMLNAFDADSMSVNVSYTENELHVKSIDDIFYQNGMFCFIDSDKDLFMYDISRKSKIYIRNIASLMEKYGVITGIAHFYDDIIIGFRANGIIQLRASDRYADEIVDRNIRIYGIYSDPKQGLLWIASDGQGAVMCSRKYSIATNLMLSRLSPDLSRQVRSIMTDRYGGLWFGTKGDGLIHVPGYGNDNTDIISGTKVYSPGKRQDILSYTRRDNEFQVYELAASGKMNGFWIGAGDPGLFCYSYADDAVHEISYPEGISPVTDIHEIHEENDSILYATTVDGFYRMIVDHGGSTPRVRSLKRYSFYHEQREIKMFYPMLPDGDSILWLGSREKGLVRFDRRTEEYQVVSLKERLHKSVDDILSLYRAADGSMYAGTTSGLVCVTCIGKRITTRYIGREQGLLNDMIHGIQEDENGCLWLGTNRGLVKYNPSNGSSHNYYYSAGVQIGEFSDDAYYRCPWTGRLFLGGIDGLLYLDSKGAAVPDIYPDIVLRKLSLGRVAVNIDEHCAEDGKTLILEGDKASFTLSFTVPDYLTGQEVEYSFILDGYDNRWTSFSGINEASYTDVPAGKYTLKARYKKDVFDTEYKLYTIDIRILPPWYRSFTAYCIYIILALVLAAYIYFLFDRHVLHRRSLPVPPAAGTGLPVGTVTPGIDRETLDGLAVISHACDRLNDESATPDEIHRHVDMISETVTSIISRRENLRTDSRERRPDVKFVMAVNASIYDLSTEVLWVLKSEGTDTSLLHTSIPVNFTFLVYKNALRCIMYYCYLAVCHGTETGGAAVTVREENGLMLFEFTGSQELLESLGRDLTGTAVSDPVTDDRRMLPDFVRSAISRLHVDVNHRDTGDGKSLLRIVFRPAPIEEDESASEKKTVLLLEEREEKAWLINEILQEAYSVRRVRDMQTAVEEIRRSFPAAMIADMSEYPDAESIFPELIAKNRSTLSQTSFIALISEDTGTSFRRKLIRLTDSQVTLPGDIVFLKDIVNKAIYGRWEAKQIYLEDLGDLAGQITCTTAEQADFIRKLLQVIELNLDEEEFGTTLIADRMAMSPRQFYRKFKEVSAISPSNLIKNYKMEKAARLLREGELSIRDIIADVGISSRSYFYKEFQQKFGMTPKDYKEQYRGV